MESRYAGVENVCSSPEYILKSKNLYKGNLAANFRMALGLTSSAHPPALTIPPAPVGCSALLCRSSFRFCMQRLDHGPRIARGHPQQSQGWPVWRAPPLFPVP